MKYKNLYFALIAICISHLITNKAWANNSNVVSRNFAELYQTKPEKQNNKSGQAQHRHNKTSLDAQNRMRVFAAIAQDLPWTTSSLHDAAIIFQHTNTENEKLDAEQYRSQEMHLLTYFLLREEVRLLGNEMSGLLGIYRYLVVSNLPFKIEINFKKDVQTNKWTINEDAMNDNERLSMGFPFKLREVIDNTYSEYRPVITRNNARQQETNNLYIADQQTRSLFKKNEMIFNRYIERVGDAQRRARLYELISQDLLWDANDFYFAAKILQNTPSITKQAGVTQFKLQENHLLAFFLARQALKSGHNLAAALMIESMNSYLKASQMPNYFRLKHQDNQLNSVCQSDENVSVELWGKFEFPFHLGKAVRDFCPRKIE